MTHFEISKFNVKPSASFSLNPKSNPSSNDITVCTFHILLPVLCSPYVTFFPCPKVKKAQNLSVFLSDFLSLERSFFLFFTFIARARETRVSEFPIASSSWRPLSSSCVVVVVVVVAWNNYDVNHGELDRVGEQNTESLHRARWLWRCRRQRLLFSMGSSSFCRRRRWPGPISSLPPPPSSS